MVTGLESEYGISEILSDTPAKQVFAPKKGWILHVHDAYWFVLLIPS